MSVKEKLIEILKQYPDINGVTIQGHDFNTINKSGLIEVLWDKDSVERDSVTIKVFDLYTTLDPTVTNNYDSIMTSVVSLVKVNTDFAKEELLRGVDF